MTESELKQLFEEGQTIFACKVKPNAAKTSIISYKDTIFHINVKAPARDNKANIALIKYVSKLLGKKVSISSGKSARVKIIKVL